MSFPRRVTAGVLLRSLLVQGSWNYETLIGTGFAFTLLPALRHLYGRDPVALREAISRHAGIFNSHPYLATVAAGAVSRLESEGTDPRLIERFKSALRSSLGSLGDILVWSAWRPAAMLLALVLLLAGAVWWVSVVVFLVVYNVLALGLRLWGWRIGNEAGLQVGKSVREAPLQQLARRVADVGAVLGGAAVVLAAGPELASWPRAAAVALGAGLGLWLGSRTRTVFTVGLVFVWVLAIAWGWSR
jgi:PTS system mannose-specific IID component